MMRSKFSFHLFCIFNFYLMHFLKFFFTSFRVNTGTLVVKYLLTLKVFLNAYLSPKEELVTVFLINSIFCRSIIDAYAQNWCLPYQGQLTFILRDKKTAIKFSKKVSSICIFNHVFIISCFKIIDQHKLWRQKCLSVYRGTLKLYPDRPATAKFINTLNIKRKKI